MSSSHRSSFAVTCMWTLAIVALVSAGTPAAAQNAADDLATIAEVENDVVKQRFEFVLRRLNDACPDLDSEGHVAGEFKLAHSRLREATLDQEEGLAALANNLHRLAHQARLPEEPCGPLWERYVDPRLSGLSVDEANQLLERPAENLTGHDEAQWHPHVVYGVGVAAIYADSVGDQDYVLAKRTDVQPAFAVSVLWGSGKWEWEFGPMLVTEINIGESAPVSLESAGLGFMVAFREKDESGLINGFGIGIAYMIDRGVVLEHRSKPDLTMETTGHSIVGLLTYSFGKRNH